MCLIGTTSHLCLDEWWPGPSLGLRDVLEKVKPAAVRVLYIDHLFARMQRLNTYEAKTNARTRSDQIYPKYRHRHSAVNRTRVKD